MIQIITGPIIAAGESLSPAVDTTAGEIVRLTMPTAWDGVPLTFQISSDNQGFNDVFTADGHEVTVNVVPGSAVIVPVNFLAAAAFIKFRSGTRDHPVPQSAQRDFAIAIRVPDVAPASDAIRIRLVP